MTTIHDNWPKRIQPGVVYCPYLPVYSTYVPEQFEFDFVKEIIKPVEYQTLMYFDDFIIPIMNYNNDIELVNSKPSIEHDLSEAKTVIEELSWNLAGCNTIADGYSKPWDYDKSAARPALDSVSRMAEKLERATKERDNAVRRAGATIREMEDLIDSQKRRTRWLDRQGAMGSPP